MFNIILTSSCHWLLTTTFWTLSDSQTNILRLRRFNSNSDFKLWCPEVQSSRYAVSVLAPTPTYSTIVQHLSKTVLFSCLLRLVIYELQIRLMKTDAWFRGCDPWSEEPPILTTQLGQSPIRQISNDLYPMFKPPISNHLPHLVCTRRGKRRVQG